MNEEEKWGKKERPPSPTRGNLAFPLESRFLNSRRRGGGERGSRQETYFPSIGVSPVESSA